MRTSACVFKVDYVCFLRTPNIVCPPVPRFRVDSHKTQVYDHTTRAPRWALDSVTETLVVVSG